MPDFKDLTISRVTDVTDPVQLTRFTQQVMTWINGLTYNGQVQRTGIDTFKLGGPGDALGVADGGTGRDTLTDHAVLIGSGTDPVDFAGPVEIGRVLISQGTSADPVFTATPVLGKAGTTLGSIGLSGNTSGVVSILPQAAAGTFNFNLPTGAGTTGQPLLSGGGGSSPQTYGTLSVAGGGTGATTLAASGVLLGNGTSAVTAASASAIGQILSGDFGGLGPTFTNTPVLGEAGVAAGSITIASATSGQTLVTVFGAVAKSTRFNLPLSSGTAGQSLLSGGGGNNPMAWGSPTAGSIVVGTTSIAAGSSGHILYDNAGVLGEYPIGTGVATALAVNVGSAGAFVVLGGALGTPSSGTLTNATGLPVGTGISGFGTGVATALAVNVGSAGAFVTFNGALGTPSSGTLTNCTGLPISSGVSGLGTGVATFLTTPSSANLAAALTDELGTGFVVFSEAANVTTAGGVWRFRGAFGIQVDNGATDGFYFQQFNTNSWALGGLSPVGSILRIDNAIFRVSVLSTNGLVQTSGGDGSFSVVTAPTVTGSRGGNAALASLLTQLASINAIVDSTTA